MDPSLAEQHQAEELLALREEAARWLVSLGVRQWEPGEVSLAQVRSQVEQAQWWVVQGGAGLRAALRVLGEDPDAWGQQSEAALYVHGLVVARQEAGQGLGTTLLRWVERLAAGRGVGAVRLDCVESNERLRAYYRGQGFEEVGRVTWQDPRWHPGVLLQKRLR